MANTYTGVFQTLISGFNEATMAKRHYNRLMNVVTRDIKPEYAAPYSTINTNIPDSGFTPTNLASGSTLSLSNVTLDPGTVTLAYHDCLMIDIPSFDTARGGSTWVDKIIDEAELAIGNAVNQAIAGLFTTANFNVHPIVLNSAYTDTSFFTGQATAPATSNVSLTTFNAAWATLAGSQVQLADKTHLMLPVPVHQNVMNSPNFVAAMSSGGQVAGEIARTGSLGQRAGIKIDFDPDLDTVLSGGGYLCPLIHEYSCVLASRPIPLPTTPYVEVAYVDVLGLPCRVIQQFYQGTMSDRISLDVCYGVAVTRPDFGVLIQTT